MPSSLNKNHGGNLLLNRYMGWHFVRQDFASLKKAVVTVLQDPRSNPALEAEGTEKTR